MKLLGLIALVLLLATLLSPAGHRTDSQRHQLVAPVQIIRSPLATRAPKTVRRVAK